MYGRPDRRIKIKRAALSLATAIGALLALGPGTGWAAGETTLSYSGNPMAGSSITVSASPGQANNIAVGIVDFNLDGFPDFAIRDASRVTESPDTEFCAPMPPFEVRCMAQGLQSFSLQPGDMPDVLRISIPSTATTANLTFWNINTGTGDDVVIGRVIGDVDNDIKIAINGNIRLEAGNDAANVSGNARVSGGEGKDKLRGGRGNQQLFGNQHKDRISCGRGKRDLGNGGGGTDTIASSCERIVNP